MRGDTEWSPTAEIAAGYCRRRTDVGGRRRKGLCVRQAADRIGPDGADRGEQQRQNQAPPWESYAAFARLMILGWSRSYPIPSTNDCHCGPRLACRRGDLTLVQDARDLARGLSCQLLE